MLDEIQKNVHLALNEDIGAGDLTALLVPELEVLTATVISKEEAVLCGRHWFELCFKTLSQNVQIQWFAQDGDTIAAQQNICEINGQARALLTAERSALNFLQMLSAVATQTKRYVEAITGTDAIIVDTRKTLPGLRVAQKYAVKCGGGRNHRIGLYDGILIKENHIAASGGIQQALKKAQVIAPEGVFVEIEVESIKQLQVALDAGAAMILLDNFTIEQLAEAVAINQNHDQAATRRALLEASGNISLSNVRLIAETGVDRISIGGLTKNIKAIDFSMRIV